MEAIIHECLSFPTHETFNQNSAIRQFCPARIEQEQQQWTPSMLLLAEEMDFDFIPEDFLVETPPSEIVDIFFNLECYEKDNADKSSSSEEENEALDQFLFQEQSLQQNSPIINEFVNISDAPMINEGDDLITNQGLHLVHLLLACAEAVGCRDTRLANSILNQIWPCVTPWGDSLQRVSHSFAMGLKCRLSFLQNVNPNGSFNHGAIDVSMISREQKTEAFVLLHEKTPYIAFGFMAANDAIIQASMGKDLLHIVDLGMQHTLQWPSLVKALPSRIEGPPRIIRITGVIGDQDPLQLENSMKGLIQEAYFHGIHLEFHLVNQPVSPSTLTREKLDLREGESLFVNSFTHLHKHVEDSRASLKIILQSIKKLNPILLTVIEQDANHNGPFFLGRFLESIHYYSAIFDSIEASLPQNSTERLKIEKFHFSEEIRNVVAYEGSDRNERHERGDQWRRQLGRVGFVAVGLKCLGRVEEMVSGYGCDDDGSSSYTVGSEKGCLQLGWKGKAIMFASAWRVNK